MDGYFSNPKEFAYRMFNTTHLSMALPLLENQIVFDLGAGRNTAGYALSCLAKSKKYVAVEPVWSLELSKKLSSPEQYAKECDWVLKQGIPFDAQPIPYEVVSTDMLAFLQTQKANSGAILASGIDRMVISDNAYAFAVEDEILRVMSSGMVFCCSRFFNNTDIDERRNYSALPFAILGSFDFGTVRRYEK